MRFNLNRHESKIAIRGLHQFVYLQKNTTFAYGFGGVIDTQKILEGHSREKLLNHDPKASDVQTSSNSTACKTGESKQIKHLSCLNFDSSLCSFDSSSSFQLFYQCVKKELQSLLNPIPFPHRPAR